MKTPETELLLHIAKATEMGMDGIRTVLPKAKDAALKRELDAEYREYGSIRDEACRYLHERGEEIPGVSAVAKASSEMMTNVETLLDGSDSKLADMMIQGTTMGVTKSVRKLNDYQGGDEAVRALADRLKNCEEARIEHLKAFL